MESPTAASGVTDPVYVVMAKRPEVGRTKTRLSPPLTLHEAAALYEAMLRDTIELVGALASARLAIAVTPPEAADDIARISPPGTLLVPVAGSDIGDCLNKVLTSLLASGSRAAFAVNSDGPTLPLVYLEGAQEQLKQADVVLGPSEDGGYYLIGLKQPHSGLFRGVDWSTERVTVQTLERAESLGLRVAQLPPWYDVDTAEDLERLRMELRSLPADALVHTRRFFDRQQVVSPTDL